MSNTPHIPLTSHHHIEVDGLQVFYREAGPANAPVIRHEYLVGIQNPELIQPEGYTLDAALLARPGNIDIQLDLFLDYANNVKLYPAFQEYFRRAQPPLLAV